jgi:hypothetical protein
MECDDNSDLEEKLKPHRNTYAKVREFVIDFANKKKIKVNEED